MTSPDTEALVAQLEEMTRSCIAERASRLAAESRVSALSAEVERLKAGGSLADALQQYPLGTTFKIEHDGFEGQVCGYYERGDGKRGVVLQQIGTRVVHVYGEKWLRASLNGGSDHG